MAGKFIKGLAVAAGAGLAVGLSLYPAPGRRRGMAPIITPSYAGNILERLERIEARLAVVEALALPLPDVEIALESILIPRVEDLRARLHAEMLESVGATLTKFERTIDSKVSLRMATVEEALTNQSAMIVAMSWRAIASETQLQRLVSAVERLCEPDVPAPTPTAPPASVPMPANEPTFFNLPFEQQLNEALEREPGPLRVIHEGSAVNEERPARPQSTIFG